MKFTSIYLSRIIGIKIISHEFQVIGKLLDLGVTHDLQNPKVAAVKVKTKDGIKHLNWEHFSIKKQKSQYHITSTRIEEVPAGDYLFLKRNVVDRQIIDVNGRKVVRANDIRLVLLSSGFFVVAVDIGTEGLLRRLGVAKPLLKLGIKLPAKLLLWSDVETVFTPNENIILSKTYNKLATLHPSDLADIIEDFDTKTGMIIFSGLDKEKSADVLEEMEEETQLKMLENLETGKAADILEEMPADEVADILDGLREDKAEELLNEMEKEASDEVRELMEYNDDLVGSLMTTDVVSFKSDTTVEQTINSLRELKPDEDQMYYIFVTSQQNKLIGTVSLRDIVISQPNIILKSIVHKDFVFMKDTDEIDELVKVASKYNLFAIPIVDGEMNLVGSVIINDIIYELLKSRRKIA
ncbi:MAG: CBS domain-containing protein [Ignavibacteriales bacterium]|nr:CBS domain-containing protein [Ignavibacteriales bacterium]